MTCLSLLAYYMDRQGVKERLDAHGMLRRTGALFVHRHCSHARKTVGLVVGLPQEDAAPPEALPRPTWCCGTLWK